MKIRPVKAEFCADRQTDRHGAGNGRLLQFCKRAKNDFYPRVTIVTCEAMPTASVKAPIHSHIFRIFAEKHKRVILLLLLLFAKAFPLLRHHAA